MTVNDGPINDGPNGAGVLTQRNNNLDSLAVNYDCYNFKSLANNQAKLKDGEDKVFLFVKDSD